MSPAISFAAEAMYRLGLCCGDGTGVPKDLEQQRRWFEKAAALGHGSALCKLGSVHLLGEGVEADAAEAVRLFELGAALGNAQCMAHLASCYCKGQGVQRDEEQGLQWLQRSAELGHEGAQASLDLRAAAAGTNRACTTRGSVSATDWVSSAA